MFRPDSRLLHEQLLPARAASSSKRELRRRQRFRFTQTCLLQRWTEPPPPQAQKRPRKGPLHPGKGKVQRDSASEGCFSFQESSQVQAGPSGCSFFR